MTTDHISILLFLAQGFEDLEAVAILDVFGWTHYRDDIPRASVITTGFHDVVRGRFGLEIKPDILFSGIDPVMYDALVLPGGFHSHGYDEAYDARVLRLARDIHDKGGHIATMCVGAVPIAASGLLQGKRAVTYPFSRNRDNVEALKTAGAIIADEPVVMDDRIITCKGPGSSLDVAFLLMERLLGPEAEKKVRRYMLYDKA